MNTPKVKKLEHFTDIFKGTCELYNYRQVEFPVLDGASPRKSLMETASKVVDGKDPQKVYFEGVSFNDGEHREFGAIITGLESDYRIAELITLATKILYNADIYETTIILDTDRKKLAEMLDLVDLVVKEDKVSRTEYDKDIAFEIETGDYTVVHGGGKDGVYYFIIDYRAIEDLLSLDYKNMLDVYISPKTPEVLEDAFAISTNLKDAGFKIETDYEMKIKDFAGLNADFLITMDEADIAKYVVHLKDLKTKEEREVMIDNLIEELFI